jgi:DNA-directed RNA polymerase II subunit RPB2
MTNNFVYVFQKKQPSKFSWIAEVRSYLEDSNDKPLTFTVKLFNKVIFTNHLNKQNLIYINS